MAGSMSHLVPATNRSLDVTAILAWYDAHARAMPWRVSPADRQRGIRPDPYRVWLSEVMLQQTTVITVHKYFRRFIARWPTVQDLAAAPLDAVLAEWAGLGYYARARNLHACAKMVVDQFGGRFPPFCEQLRELPGIGPYTSASISAICFDERQAVLDGNVERVLARFIALDQPVREVKANLKDLLQTLVPHRAGDFAQAMMDLGATICTPKVTLCPACPLKRNCAANALGAPLEFPVRSDKKPRPNKHGHTFVMRRPDGAILLRRRPEKGMLAQMTETPGGDWSLEGGKPQFPVVGSWSMAGTVRHIFTHFSLDLDVWLLDDSDFQPADGQWWSLPEELPGEALPSLYRKVLVMAGIEN